MYRIYKSFQSNNILCELNCTAMRNAIFGFCISTNIIGVDLISQMHSLATHTHTLPLHSTWLKQFYFNASIQIHFSNCISSYTASKKRSQNNNKKQQTENCLAIKLISLNFMRSTILMSDSLGVIKATSSHYEECKQ